MPASVFTFTRSATMLLTAAVAVSSCSSPDRKAVVSADASPARLAGRAFTLKDTTVQGKLDAAGVAEPFQQATLATKLMGTVTAVRVQEGDIVQRGQLLVQIDARDVTAKASQVAASIADAEAMQAEATTQAARIRALYADSAATRAQYDAAQTGLSRADAGLRAARAAGNEVAAIGSYAAVRAPFAGIVTARFADVGTFAAPGSPLLTVQDASTLRISVRASGLAVRGLTRGQQVTARIEGRDVGATIEGIVPAGAGNLFTVNAIVRNRDGAIRAGSAATIQLPSGERQLVLVPIDALVRDGDLTGVIIRGTARDERRWVRVGATYGTMIEVTSGIRAGETVVVPERSAATPAAAGA